MEQPIKYIVAKSREDFLTARQLFEEYAKSLNFDLCFQNFEGELLTIDQQYNTPVGALLLAYNGETAIGCVGVRKFDDEVAELKRMYVKSEYRGLHIGATLLQKALDLATELGYSKIRLDSLSTMTKALELYKSFGFYTIPSYRYNPIPDTVYLEKDLQ